MTKTLFKSFIVAITLGFAQLSIAKEVVVLVPGFFNTFTPEYFSEDIVKAFQKKGFQVYVADKLSATGYINENGARLEKLFQQIEKIENRKVAFNIVAHSAGGFYSMWVANRHNFEIKTILTISTPYLGVDFVQTWHDNSMMFRALMELARLESVEELTPIGAKKFIDSVRIRPETKMYAFGGTQSPGIDITNARNLSLPMQIPARYTKGKSDGIVSFTSAMGIGGLKTTNEVPAQQFRDEKFNINLEHWEQVLDYRSFLLLGTRNIGYIRNEQIRFYGGLAQLLTTLN